MLHAEGLEFGLHLRFAIAAVGRHCLRHLVEPRRHATAGGDQHGGVGRVALLDPMVDDDAVDVVGDLCLVAELDRLAEPTLGDRTGVGVVQRHDPGRSVGDLTGETGPGLDDDLLEHADGALELGDEGAAWPEASHRHGEGPAGVGGHDLGVFDGGLGDGGQLAGQAEHLVFGVAAAPAQPGRDLMGTTTHRAGAVPKAGPSGQPKRLERTTVLVSLATPLASSPESVG